jgi:hypothetical protein
MSLSTLRSERLSFPPETATATRSPGAIILYFEIVFLAFSTIDPLKQEAQSVSPE